MIEKKQIIKREKEKNKDGDNKGCRYQGVTY